MRQKVRREHLPDVKLDMEIPVTSRVLTKLQVRLAVNSTSAQDAFRATGEILIKLRVLLIHGRQQQIFSAHLNYAILKQQV